MRTFGKNFGSNPFEEEGQITPELVTISERSSVVDDIKQFARSEYPNDFSMQKYIFDEQMKAHAWLKDFSDPRIPLSVMASIRKEAKVNYPNDYNMQKYIVEEQVEGFLYLAEQ